MAIPEGLRYQPPIINTYPISVKAREWRVLSVDDERVRYIKMHSITITLILTWLAVAISSYFLATTHSGTITNAIYISPIAVSAVLGTVVGVGVCCSKPLLVFPQFEKPGVTEVLLTHILKSDLDTLCDYLHNHADVSALVQSGFLRRKH